MGTSGGQDPGVLCRVGIIPEGGCIFGDEGREILEGCVEGRANFDSSGAMGDSVIDLLLTELFPVSPCIECDFEGNAFGVQGHSDHEVEVV